MIIKNFNKISRKDNVVLTVQIVVSIIILAWLIIPPLNKLLQVTYWGYNVKYFAMKLYGYKMPDYLFYRNNAVYLAKMYPKEPVALKEMDRAIAAIPPNSNENILKSLYKDRAEIKLYFGDKKGALEDFVRSEDLNINDYLKVGLLYIEAGKYNEAYNTCREIFSKDVKAYSGYICMSEIFIANGRLDQAVKWWDLAIDRRKASPRSYVSRALVKKSMGDLQGYNEDMQVARKYYPNIKEDYSLARDTLYPKKLLLETRY